jgi:hypothetical protein
MIITIDTSKDSKEDISKAIKFLKGLCDETVYDNNQPKTYQPEETATNAFGSMFSEVPKEPRSKLELY